MTIIRTKINGLIVDQALASAPNSKKNMVFVHGAGGGSWYWENYMRWYSQQGFNCYAINLRGHLPNAYLPNLGSVSIRDYVADVEGLLETLQGETILVGHSMGGLISQEITASNKFSISALIIIGSAPPKGIKMEPPKLKGILRKIKAFFAGLGILYKIMRKAPLVPVLAASQNFVGNCLPKDQQHAFHNKLVPESSYVGLEVIKGVITANLSELSLPKLAVGGEKDLVSLITMQEKIAKFQKMELKKYANHGHMLMMEPGWEAIATDINVWLDEKSVGMSERI